jgi:Chaperone of endosialidase
MPALKRTKSLSASVLLLSIGATAYGQVPPTNDTSDPNTVNTGVGTGTLQSNGGSENTAVGVNALALDTTGYENTATGVNALVANTTGFVNTAFGYAVLASNTTGQENTATGFTALYTNTSGSQNTADGAHALGSNTTGANNTGSGIATLALNTTGFSNSALGGSALLSNTTGAQNTGVGGAALLSNTTGNNNIGVGMNAGSGITTGNNNIAIGLDAGSNLTTGNADIDIGNVGVAGEGHTIRIGNAGQHTKTFIAGIWGSRVRKGAEVVVNSDGQLGVEESSERYKSDIAPMGSVADKIQQLRPVTYHLKNDPSGDLQYGLIAEEVDQVYPELVVRDDAGNIEGVRYDRLAPILLSEVQQQQRRLATQAEQLGELKQQFADLQELNREMRVALMKLQAKESQVAMR